MQSLRELLERSAAPRMEAIAMLAPGGASLTYGALLAQVDRVVAALRGRVAPDDRVAIVAPDSARTAVAMLGAMSGATLAPLDARLTRDELAQQLRRLRASLVIVDPASPQAATLAAADARVPVATLVADAADAIPFSLVGLDALPVTHAVASAPRGGADVAIVLCTSGTTGKPKLVPLTHDNLLTTMRANGDVLALTHADRCLGVMPLCHIHGLGAVLCSLLAGGSIAVLPAFAADAFYAGLTTFAPTWYTSVPTIHQAVLDHAAADADVVARAALRMIRSGSAPMPIGVPERLEATFAGARYVEAFGATEASAYLASNRPATRRIGTVGQAMPGTELRVVDEWGDPLPPGTVGEIVARGPGVFAGYEDDDDATRDAFTADGAFRTGDLGRIDEDGFITMTGRAKEQINRGGTKISPAEVEAAIDAHAAVARSAAFGVADARLGQEVGAIVVLRAGATCTALELQRHLATQVADFKVPRHVVFAETIPVGPRGKIERLRLAEQLGLNAAAAATSAATVGWSPPHEPVEQAIAAIWSEVLGADVWDVTAPFFALGGDSAQALSVCLKIESRFGRPMPLAAIGARPSIRGLAALLADDGWSAEPGAPIVLRDGEPAQTLFVLPGVGGNVYSYHALARRLPAGVRVVGLPLPGADGLEPPLRTMPAIARRYAEHVRAMQPAGGGGGGARHALAGYSFGGRVACEVARLLADDAGGGAPLPFVALLDVRGPNWPPPPSLARRVARKLKRVRWPGSRVAARAPVAEPSAAELVAEVVAPAWLPEPHRSRQQAMIAACDAASDRWAGPSMRGIDAWLFRAAVSMWSGVDLSDRSMGWARPTGGTVHLVEVPGSHVTMLHEPHVATLASRLGEAMKTTD